MPAIETIWLLLKDLVEAVQDEGRRRYAPGESDPRDR